MDLRRAAPFVFAALCLGLSTLVLRRQISAHPMPRTVTLPREPSGGKEPINPGPPTPAKPWHVATGPARQEVLTIVVGQLTAIREGNADRAWFYQSQGLRRNFRSGADFEKMIVNQYPEFGHSRLVSCGPVLTDPTGTYAGVSVTVLGENGRRARGYYELIREEGGYKVAGVTGGRPVK